MTENTANTQKPAEVPFIVYESAQVHAEATQRRLIVAIIALSVMLFLSNIAWLYYWNQYEYVGNDNDVTVSTDVGDANYIGRDGDINADY